MVLIIFDVTGLNRRRSQEGPNDGYVLNRGLMKVRIGKLWRFETPRVQSFSFMFFLTSDCRGRRGSRRGVRKEWCSGSRRNSTPCVSTQLYLYGGMSRSFRKNIVIRVLSRFVRLLKEVIRLLLDLGFPSSIGGSLMTVVIIDIKCRLFWQRVLRSSVDGFQWTGHSRPDPNLYQTKRF